MSIVIISYLGVTAVSQNTQISDDYVVKFENLLASQLQRKISWLKIWKQSFSFVENPLLVNAIENGCPILNPIATDYEAFKIDHLELLEMKVFNGLKTFPH